MNKLYHFFGGVTFAIFLIVSAALFVIAGTLIESKTGSHLYAASLTYKNPLFNLLICGFFINIFFSATRRFPFKKRHIPFLMTHLGLLMILSGVMAKNIFGTQGQLSVIEGSATNLVLLANTHALYVENKKETKQFKLNDNLKQLDDLNIEIVGYQPNIKEKLQTWIKGHYVFIYGFPPFLVGEKIHTKLHQDYPEFEILALIAPPDKTVEEIAEEYKKPLLLLLIKDLDDDIFIFLYDKQANLFSETFKSNSLKSVVAYDKGFYGYAAEFKFPLLLTSKEKQLEKIKTVLNETKEPLQPPLELLRKASQRQGQLLGDLLISYLEEEDQYEHLIYTGDFKLPELDLKLVTPHDYKACCLMASLFPILEKKKAAGENILKFLKKTGWPFIKNLKEKEDQIFELLTEQIDVLGDHLPDLSLPSQNAFFSAYLRLYSINLNKMLENIKEEPVFVTLETPVTAKHEKATRSQKIEDEKPVVYLELNKQERLALSYDSSGKGLKWPALNGNFLLRFQPESRVIPYRVRLQNARQISYANSNINFSFEADLKITDIEKETKDVTISMNRVYETWDGYRFYLSNISPGIEGEMQRAEIIVSHDPTKYILTYPGAFILSLGIILVFWFSHYFK